MLHVQCLKQKGPGHLGNAFHIALIIALELLEILSRDPVANFCSKEKKSRTEWNSEKVQDFKTIFFSFYSRCKTVSVIDLYGKTDVIRTHFLHRYYS